MQKYCNLNLGWRFKEGFEEEYITGGKDEEGRLVHVPHTVKEVPYDCFDQTMTCMISTYIRSFQLPDMAGKRALVSFEGVSACYDLYINGHKAGSHKGPCSMALFDRSRGHGFRLSFLPRSPFPQHLYLDDLSYNNGII